MREELEVRAKALELAIRFLADHPMLTTINADPPALSREGQILQLAMKFETFLVAAIISDRGSERIR